MLRVPLTKMKRSRNTAVFFLCLVFVLALGFAVLILPLLTKDRWIYFAITEGVLMMIMMFFFTVASCLGKNNKPLNFRPRICQA